MRRGFDPLVMDDHRGPTFFDWITDLLVLG